MALRVFCEQLNCAMTLLSALRQAAPVVAALALGACASLDSRIALPAPEPLPPAAPAAPSLASDAYWASLREAEVIYVGEKHDDAAHHAYQFEVIQGLKARGIPFVIGWEMFDVTQQPLLDAWQARTLGTEQMLQQTNFQKTWGRLSPFYEKMLRWAALSDVRCLALNAPPVLARKLSRGIRFTREERRLLPAGFAPLPGGLEHFTAQMGSHPGPALDYERYYRAQTLWDQTMAERIVQARRRHPGIRVVVFAGRGHVEGGFGIPPYVQQKLPNARQILLLPGEPPIEAALPPLVRRIPAVARPGLNTT